MLLDNHPAIVDEDDFWYAFDRLSPATFDGQKQERDNHRARHTKDGYEEHEALLEDIVTSESLPVYVFQDAEGPEKAAYAIINCREYGGREHRLGSIYVRELDAIFTTHLLEKLEEGNQRRAQYPPEEKGLSELDTTEEAMVGVLVALLKKQQVSTAGIDKQIAEYSAEADSLDRTLHYGAKKLDGKTIENFSERLGRLRTTIAQLEAKKKRAAKAQEELAEFAEGLDDIPQAWKSMKLAKQQRFIRLVTEKIILTKPAQNWLKLEVKWSLWDDAPSICYIWQRRGEGESWTDEEKELLRTLYPHATTAMILEQLPTRNWSAILMQAMRMELSRTYQLNTSGLHKLVSVEDAEFMEQAGIPFDLYNPGKRVQWITAKESTDTSTWRLK
jgi:hypothetical protein